LDCRTSDTLGEMEMLLCLFFSEDEIVDLMGFSWVFMGFNGIFIGFNGIYPLVN